jgi:hypothetical protein
MACNGALWSQLEKPFYIPVVLKKENPCSMKKRKYGNISKGDLVSGPNIHSKHDNILLWTGIAGIHRP